MKLARFEADGRERVGIIEGETIIDCSDQPGLDNLPAILDAGESGRRRLQDFMRGGAERRPVSEVRLLAPIQRPGKFLCVGLNYLDHIEETGAKPPEYPKIFNKQSTCVIGPGDPIQIPRVSDKWITKVSWAWS